MRPVSRALAAMALLIGSAWSAVAEPARVNFIHFNDVYEFAGDAQGGGLPVVKALVSEARRQDPATLVTFGGDLLSPSMASSLTQGAHMIELMNAMGLSAATLGNHEFDFGAETLRRRMAEARFPWLVANLAEPDGSRFANAVPLRLVEANGVRVGLFGLLTPDTATMASGGQEVRFDDPIKAARTAVTELRRQRAEVVVALTHLDLDQDRELARQVTGIDLILGGHDHAPIAIQEHDTLLVKAGHDGVYLAEITLEVERRPNAGVRPVQWRFVATLGGPRDPDLAAITDRMTGELEQAMDRPLATLGTGLDSRGDQVRSRETTMGNLVADSLRIALGAEIALVNGGGLRGNRLYAAGAGFSRLDVLRELPFGNLAVLLEISGADLVAALEHGLAKAPSAAGRFPQLSGMIVTYDPLAPAGARVQEVLIGTARLDPHRRYRLATIDYLADGGDGFAMLRNAKPLVERSAAPLLAATVADELARLGTVSVAVQGRIRELAR